MQTETDLNQKIIQSNWHLAKTTTITTSITPTTNV